MPPFRVVVTADERRTATTVVVELARSPDIGATIDLPYGQRVIVQAVVRSREEMMGVAMARPF
jgi:hypothetical protein